MIARLAALCLIMLTSMIGLIARLPRTISPLDRTLAFTYYDATLCGAIECGYRLAFLARDGVTRLENLPYDVNPASLAWSPDGSRLAFIAGRDASLYLIDADGENPQRLLEGAFSAPSWSPEGGRIAVTGSALVGSRIFMIDLATRRYLPLPNTGQTDCCPVWSPNSEQIAYIALDPVMMLVITDPQGRRRNVWSNAGGLYLRAGGWSADGAQVTVLSTGRLNTLDVSAEQMVSQSTLPDINVRQWSALTPDLLLLTGEQLYAYDAARDQLALLEHQPTTAPAAVYPHGEWLALRLHTHVCVLTRDLDLVRCDRL